MSDSENTLSTTPQAPSTPVRKREYRFSGDDLLVPEFKRAPGDAELHRLRQINGRKRRWQEMVTKAQGTFTHNTVCPRCGFQLGEGVHKVVDWLTIVRHELEEDMERMDMEVLPTQEKLDEFRDRWVDLEMMWWDDCGKGCA